MQRITSVEGQVSGKYAGGNRGETIIGITCKEITEDIRHPRVHGRIDLAAHKEYEGSKGMQLGDGGVLGISDLEKRT